jgi:transcriptional regulator GlxA family with amidase domain
VNAASHRVAVLVYDGVTLLDVAGPAEVFKEANRFGAHYRIVLLSPTGANVTSSLGVRIAVDGAVSSEQAFAIDAVRRLLESIHPPRMAQATELAEELDELFS